MKNSNTENIDLGLNRSPSGIADEDVMVALLNMGGPKTNADVRAFQSRLFNDTRLIRFPLSKILQPLFAWALVTFRGKASEERYQLIGGGSPLFSSTQAQTEALRRELKKRGRGFSLTFSFNYSEPLPEQTIAETKQANKKYLLPLSMYPHYSSATTGSNLYYLKKAAEGIYPQLQFLPTPLYYLHPDYIQGFVDRVHEQLKPGESLDDFYLIFSAHGLPVYFIMEGDPYPNQIAQSVALVLNQLKRKDKWIVAYQSAVGPMKWMTPSTEGVLRALAKQGMTKVLVVPIAFVNDHIETLCEINMEYKEFALKEGIKDFRMSRALETHPGFIKALADVIEALLPKSEKFQVSGVKSPVNT